MNPAPAKMPSITPSSGPVSRNQSSNPPPGPGLRRIATKASPAANKAKIALVNSSRRPGPANIYSKLVRNGACFGWVVANSS